MNNADLLTAIKNQHDYDVADRHMGEQRLADLIEKHEDRIKALERLGNLATGAAIILSTLIGSAWAAIIAWIGAGGINDVHSMGQHLRK